MRFYTLNLILFHFDRNVDKRQASLALFLSKIAKNAVFALCYKISIVEVRLRSSNKNAILQSQICVSVRLLADDTDTV